MTTRPRIELVPVAKLTPYARNARTHSAEQVAQIAASVREFGWTNPVLIDEGGELIAGHGRLAAALELGLAEVPAIRLKGLSEAQKRALRIADNKLALNAGWDDALLALELGDLQGLGFDLALTGFGDLELGALFAKQAPGLTAPDEVPEPPAEPVTRAGDLWLLGKHRLLCGDATNADDVQRLMNSNRAELFSTDPPYLVDYTGAARPNNSGKDWSAVYHEKPQADALSFYRSIFKNAMDVTNSNAAWYIWHAHKHVVELEQAWRELDILNHMQIVWVKPSALHTHTFYPWQHEPCLMGWRRGHKPSHDGNNSHEVTSVWSVDWEGKNRSTDNNHPTQKPVELFARPMRKHTQAGDICFEPFCGSGSQLIAGERLGRFVYALELSPNFCDVAVTRWQNFTGEKAERITSGSKNKQSEPSADSRAAAVG